MAPENIRMKTGVIGLGAGFAIGQRAILVRTPGGNLLWDCVATLNGATVTMIMALGGVLSLLDRRFRLGIGARRRKTA